MPKLAALRPTRPRLLRLGLSAFFVFVLLTLSLVGPAWSFDDPPSLNSFAILTPTVDPSAGAPNAQLLLGVSDAAPGVCTNACEDDGAPSQLTLLHPPTGQRSTTTLSPSGTPGQYVAVLTFTTTSAVGDWVVESVWLADRSGNRSFLSTADLAGRGFATVVTNLATGGDTTSPSLSAVTLSSTSIDSTGGAQVLVELTPYESDLCRAPTCALPASPSQVRFVHAGTGQTRTGLVQRDLVFVGGGFEFRNRAHVDFPDGSASGDWRLEWADLLDTAGNRRVFDAGELAGLGASVVVNSSLTGDSIAPSQTLVDSLPASAIDSTGGPVAVLFGVEAFDSGTGVCAAPDLCDDQGGVTQVVYKRDGADHRRFAPLFLDSPDIYIGGTSVPQSATADVWRPHQLMITDRAGNRMIPEPGLLPGLIAGLLAIAIRRRPVV